MGRAWAVRDVPSVATYVGRLQRPTSPVCEVAKAKIRMYFSSGGHTRTCAVVKRTFVAGLNIITTKMTCYECLLTNIPRTELFCRVSHGCGFRS